MYYLKVPFLASTGNGCQLPVVTAVTGGGNKKAAHGIFKKHCCQTKCYVIVVSRLNPGTCCDRLYIAKCLSSLVLKLAVYIYVASEILTPPVKDILGSSLEEFKSRFANCFQLSIC